MIWDCELYFSDGQVVSASAVSTHTLGKTGRTPLTNQMRCCVHVASVSGTNPTLQVHVEVAADEDFTQNAGEIGRSVVLSPAPGEFFEVPFVRDRAHIGCPFMRLSYTVGGTNPSFTLRAGLAEGIPTNLTPLY